MLPQNAIPLYITSSPSSTSSSSSHKNTHTNNSSGSLAFMDFTEKMQLQKMGFRDYVKSLEEERRKIQVFPRELPLSLELVTQAIEACRQQLSGTTTEYNLNGQSECSEQTSMEGPVLEEFIPIKKRASSTNCEEDEQHSRKAKISKDKNNNTDKMKSDWLRSVQLWNPDPAEEDVPRKSSVVEVKKRSGGAFQPFHREENAVKMSASSGSKAPSSRPVAATSSTAGAVTGGNGGSSKREVKEDQTQRKQRRSWSQELHKRFLHALQQLGGADSGTPKQIRDLMKVDGLTNDEVKSHLQKYRLHTKRQSPIVHSNANPQSAAFVLVGNIFVQQPEYAAAVATSTASGELTTVTAPTGIYAPVASHPPAVPHTPAASIKKLQFKQLELSEHSHSEERANNSEGAVHSNSPASSSSTHTTTTSPGY